jgi:RimJ/RimL family protein N-acetyltransferase
VTDLSRWTPREPPSRAPMHGRYVTLRPLSPDDADALWKCSRDESVWAYLSYGPWRDAATYHAWVERAVTTDDPLFLTVLVDGEPRGVVSYLRIDRDNGVIEIGHIWYAPSIQRTAATTEVTYLLARHVFDDLGYRRLEWKCNAVNARSRAAAERFGFAYEGTFRQHMVVKGGNRDTAWFALLDGDWPRVRAAFEAWLDPANFDTGGRQRRPLAAKAGT